MQTKILPGRVKYPEDGDFVFFQKVEGMYNAWRDAVSDMYSIIVPISNTGNTGVAKKHYAAVEGGKEIMAARRGNVDLSNVQTLHCENVGFFLEAACASEDNDRAKCGAVLERLFDNAIRYTAMVERQNSSQKGAYLMHLSCPPGRWAERNGSYSQVMFNPAQTEQGALEEIALMREMNLEFMLGQKRIADPRLITGTAMHSSNSYSAHLARLMNELR